jgi:NAD(P)H-nitrite reductase large subunit
MHEFISQQPNMSTQPDSPANEVMCHCSGTTRENIQSLFEQGMDMDAISRWTGALSGCGGCEWDIADFLEALGEQRNQRTTGAEQP